MTYFFLHLFRLLIEILIVFFLFCVCVFLFLVDMEADISQLEAPTFTTIQRGPPEPMLRLKWDHKVSLIGEKVLNPMIHCCDQCLKPILIYGRMIPCKHVFCLKCARSEPVKICPRCKEKVCRVEQSGLGTVFMCTHGGSRYGNTGCRRTYLSQRDLQAHINHRHMVSISATPVPTSNDKTDVLKTCTSSLQVGGINTRKSSDSIQLNSRSNIRGGGVTTGGGSGSGVGGQVCSGTTGTAIVGANISTITTRTNLITVTIHD